MPLVVSGTKAKEYIRLIGEHVNSPEQRLALGATALATQPFIDLNNKNVDEKTRSISVARTLAKIIAGTIVGVAVRKGAIEGIKHCKDYKFLVPGKDVIGKASEEILNKRMSNYTKAVGTLAATVMMIFTNFAIDAPLTRYLTGKFHNYIVGAKQSKESENIQQEVSK